MIFRAGAAGRSVIFSGWIPQETLSLSYRSRGFTEIRISPLFNTVYSEPVLYPSNASSKIFNSPVRSATCRFLG